MSDTDKKIGIAYGAADANANAPARLSFLIGPDGKIERAYGKVKPTDHPEQALEELRDQ
ncbi:MAG: hypothetical protein JWM53_2688 [bacterium]|nr:hypothetical protein [bacterium]